MQKFKQFIKNILIFHCINLFLEILPNHSFSNKLRGRFYSLFFKNSGKNFMVAKGVLINCKEEFVVGDNVYIAHDVWINAAGGIILEDNVIISPKVVIATTKHEYSNGGIKLRNGGMEKIFIGKGSWITSNCTITMGVSIGDGCIIAANSSVSTNIPKYKLAGGVPAKIIKDLI